MVQINATGTKSLDTDRRFTCRYLLLQPSFLEFLPLSFLVVSNSLSIFFVSLHLQALLDHFGYDVAYSKDWHLPTWYDARKFDEWFGTMRSNRRARDVMPLLHVVSSDDEDSHDNGPGSSGVQGSVNQGSAVQEGGDANGSGDPGPSQDGDE